MSSWIIKDWIDNTVCFGLDFQTFDDAEAFLSDFIEVWLGEDYDENRQEYFITERKT